MIPGHTAVFVEGPGWPRRTRCVPDHMLSVVDDEARQIPTSGIQTAFKKREWPYQWAPLGMSTNPPSLSNWWATGVWTKLTGSLYADAVAEFEKQTAGADYRFPTVEDVTVEAFKAWPNTIRKWYPVITSTPCEVELEIPDDGKYYVEDKTRQNSRLHDAKGKECVDSAGDVPKTLKLGTQISAGNTALGIGASCCALDGSELDDFTRAPCAPDGYSLYSSISLKVAATHCSLYGQKLCDTYHTRPDDANFQKNCKASWTSTKCDSNSQCGGGKIGTCYSTGDPHYPSVLFDNWNPETNTRILPPSFAVNRPGLWRIVSSQDGTVDMQAVFCAGYAKDATKAATASYNYAFAIRIGAGVVTLIKNVVLVDGVPVISPAVIEADGYDREYKFEGFSVWATQHKGLTYGSAPSLFFTVRQSDGCFNGEFHYHEFTGEFAGNGHIPYYYSQLLDMPLGSVRDGSGLCAKPTAEMLSPPALGNPALHPDPWTPTEEERLFTPAQMDQLEGQCLLKETESNIPRELPVDDLCTENGVNLEEVQDKCSALKDLDFAHMYQDCVYDGCADNEGVEDIIKDDLEIEDEVKPEVECADDDTSCDLAEACRSCPNFIFADPVGDVVSGMTYSGVTVLDGRSLDLTVKATDEYNGKNSRTGAMDGGWMRVNILKGLTTFRFTFIDSETKDEVVLPSACLTLYDLDHGKRATGQEVFQSCQHSDAALTVNTEVDTVRDGACDEFSSSTSGTAKDNPKPGQELTSLQAARSVTLTFEDKSNFDIVMGIVGKERGGRNFVISGNGALACRANEMAIDPEAVVEANLDKDEEADESIDDPNRQWCKGLRRRNSLQGDVCCPSRKKCAKKPILRSGNVCSLPTDGQCLIPNSKGNRSPRNNAR